MLTKRKKEAILAICSSGRIGSAIATSLQLMNTMRNESHIFFAEVVLVSMTTSSGEDLPRNLEFLYSKNRLNVGISRARTLAVVIANPQLLEIPCSNIAQMCLVNTLC